MAQSNHQELEVKFYLQDFAAFRRRLLALLPHCEQERTHEVNLRFDTPSGELRRSFQVLRLRKDTAARVTYKGPGVLQDGARLRQELEFVVSDFDTARLFFEALGYQVVVMYEKYRAVYAFEGALITLDEMPYGRFAEIEGPDGATIQAAARRLGLDWEARVLDSYLMLFDHFCREQGLSIDNLSFANFTGLTVTPEMLGVRPADRA